MEFSKEKIEKLRQEWREKHPEEVARRSKSNLVDVFSQEEDEENLLLDTETTTEAYRKKIKDLYDHIVTKREQYVKDRDLKASELSLLEKNNFILFLRNYNCHNQVIASVVTALAIEGLRYPDKELNSYCYNFLLTREREAPNWAFWITLWGMDFVPLDAVRLMLDIDESKLKKIDSFVPLVRVIQSKIKWHLEEEYKRLKTASKISVPDVRTREIKRKSKRIFFFQTLLEVYGYEFSK